jgi:hypothetical protein
VSVGVDPGVVVSVAAVVVGAVAVGVDVVDVDSRLGRRNHTRVAVTTTISTPTVIAVTSSRRSRGALYGTRFADVGLELRLGLIA